MRAAETGIWGGGFTAFWGGEGNGYGGLQRVEVVEGLGGSGCPGFSLFSHSS